MFTLSVQMDAGQFHDATNHTYMAISADMSWHSYHPKQRIVLFQCTCHIHFSTQIVIDEVRTILTVLWCQTC